MLRPLTRERLAPRRQRLRRLATLGRYNEELSDVDAQCIGQPVKEVNARIELTSFDVADRGPVNLGVHSQVLLTDATLPPHPTKIPSDASATDHVPQGSNLKVAIPSDIHHILRGGSMRFALLLMFATAALGPPSPAQGQESPAPLTLPPPELPRASSPLPDITAFVDALVGQWGLDSNCDALDSQVYFSRDELGDLANSRTNGVILSSNEGRCRLYGPQHLQDSVEWVANCEVEGEVLEGIAVLSLADGQLYADTPLASGILGSCTAEPVAAEAPTGVPAAADAVSDEYPIRVRPSTEFTAPAPSVPEGQRGAIATVYRDYCDPTFPVTSAADQSLIVPYQNQLLVRYRASCSQFLAAEVATVIAYDAVQDLQLAAGPSKLDGYGAQAAGMWLFLQRHKDLDQCGPGSMSKYVQRTYGDLPANLFMMATEANRTSLAAGYAIGLGVWENVKANARFAICEVAATYLIGQTLGSMMMKSSNIEEQ